MATPKKQIAKTLMNILEHPTVMLVQNNESDVRQIIDEIDGYWRHDLMSRKPSPAEYDDNGKLIKATNLDLATFLYALSDRGAVISIPKYETRRPKSVQEGVMSVTGGENRHGKIMGLVSNKKVFSFGLKLLDMSMISTDQVGFPRNFMLTDFDGSWYKGWQKINFMPNAEENKFLTENKIWNSANVTFENFVVPEKWVSFYGRYYFITKAAIARLEDEQKHLGAEKKRIMDSGIELPVDANDVITEYSKTSTKEEGEKIKVDAFEVEVDLPERIGEFKTYETSLTGLVEVCDKLREVRHALNNFRFSTRCVEYAASKKDYMNTFPVWIKNVSWETGFKFPKQRKEWNRLKITQPGVGEYSIAIRTRWYQVTETVKKGASVSDSARNASTVLS